MTTPGIAGHGGGTGFAVWTPSGYSRAERDRRYQEVRRLADARGLDCVLVPLGDGTDARYLTQLRNAAVVLPTDSRPPIVVTDRVQNGDWLDTPRQVVRTWAPAIVEALRDLRMGRARIGVAGLARGTWAHVRATDGVVNHSSFAAVLRQLPNASFVDATDVLGLARSVKSAEEVACLRRAVAIAESGIAALAGALAHGSLDRTDLVARLAERILALGSEYRAPTLDVRRTAGGAALLLAQVRAVWGAQVAVETQPLAARAGPSSAPVRPRLVEANREALDTVLACVEPGVEVRRLTGAAAEAARRRGLRGTLVLHGLGLGDDGPLLDSALEAEPGPDVRLAEGNALALTVTVASQDDRDHFTWGGGIMVTGSGAERLFQRRHGLVSVTTGREATGG